MSSIRRPRSSSSPRCATPGEMIRTAIRHRLTAQWLRSGCGALALLTHGTNTARRRENARGYVEGRQATHSAPDVKQPGDLLVLLCHKFRRCERAGIAV
jgi:hypothetical protein